MKSTRSSVQEILDSLQDEEFVNYFANVHGIVGDPDVDHRLDEIRGVNYNPSEENSRFVQIGKGVDDERDENFVKAYYVWKKQVKTYKTTLAKDTTYKVKFNNNWNGENLRDIYKKLHEMFEDVLHLARGHNADLGRVVLNHPDLINPIVVPLQ